MKTSVSWSEAVIGKGLTFHFFSDPLVRKVILVTVKCADSIITSSSTHGKDTVLPRRTTWTAKILPATDDRLHQQAMRVLTPLYKEIGACFMGDGCQRTSNRLHTTAPEQLTDQTAWQIVLALVSNQKPLAIFRKIASQPEFSQVGATERLKYADRSAFKLSACKSIVYTATVSIYMYIGYTNTGYI